MHPAASGKPAGRRSASTARRRQALPDAEHLDLIGEYLLMYAYDSPDPRNPALIGTRTVSGDIHQTAAQTLATTAGGMMRGDCDDLSELDQEIAELQGRNAQMIGLPAHAALVWAEPRPGGTWITYLLQTGQPLGFEAPTLPDSLELAYKSFGSGELFDRTKLEVLLRFSGENTRSSWYLSWRIFADPAYARTMIDVQRDWHFQTYQRAIVKMQELVAGGDEDPANYTELAGLYHYTGQYALGADALAVAIAKSEPGETRLSMQIDRVVALASADQCDAARALARELREREIPALEETHEVRLDEARLSLVRLGDGRALRSGARARDPGARRHAAGRRAGDGAGRRRSRAEKLDMETWRVQTDPMRDRLRWYVASSVARAVRDPRRRARGLAGPRGADGEASWRWLDALAFRELDPADSALSRYAVIGRLLEASSDDPNQVLAQIEAAPLPPASPALDPAMRGDRARRSARATSSSCASRRRSGRASSRRCSRRRTRRSTRPAWPTSRSAPSARTPTRARSGSTTAASSTSCASCGSWSRSSRATSARCARSCARSSSRTTGACA